MPHSVSRAIEGTSGEAPLARRLYIRLRNRFIETLAEFKLPGCYASLVGGRFFIGQDHRGVLHAIDLENLERGIQTLTHRTTDLPIVPVYGADLFVLVRHEVSDIQGNLSNPIIR